MTVQLDLDLKNDTATVVFDGVPVYAMTSRGTFRNYWDPDPGRELMIMITGALGGSTLGGV